MSYGLTSKQQRCFDFIRDYVLEHGYSPNYREIAEGMGSNSKGEASRIVNCLADRGRLVFSHGARSIRLLPAAPVLSVELPPHLFSNVQALAAAAKVTPEAVVIEAVRDGFAALRSKCVPRETPEAA